MWHSILDVPERIRQEYAANEWSCAVPPVTTARWDDLAWINHIFGPRERDADGRYAHSLDAVCVCGHRKGEHTAERVMVDMEVQQPCLEEPCGCECFRRIRDIEES